MEQNKKRYDRMVKKASKPSPKRKDFVWAYIVGGIICLFGQLLFELYDVIGLNERAVKMAVPSTLIFIAALLTGLKIFEKIAKKAGAGTLVPITGFANSIAAPAVEFKTDERDIIGLSRKAP